MTMQEQAGDESLASTIPLHIENWQPKVSKNRLAGLVHMLKGYRLMYLGATLALGLGAASKTGTYLLLAYLVDDVLLRDRIGEALFFIALSFIGLALVEGGFTFVSGTLAARNELAASR